MELNSSQKRAVAHLAGPMMVLAGPGSGKTSVIVQRTSYLIHEGCVPPSSVLVVTFSRAAAAQMKERFLKAENITGTAVTFGTFHGVFYGILKQACRLGPENILSDREKQEILKELCSAYGGEQGTEQDFQEEVAREISLVKSERLDLQHYYSTSCPDEVFRTVFTAYRDILKSRRKLDFDDMLLGCHNLFVRRKDILKLWQQKFRYILVDEFQDINRIQYEVIRMLALPENNLFIVGDDDQSIYHFRGARPGLMLNFGRDYPDAGQILLDVNYRCSANILKTASRLIRHNEKRFAKEIITPNPEGSPVQLRQYRNPSEQYRDTVREIQALSLKGMDLKKTAVLFRTNLEAEGLIRVMMEYQIPFHMEDQLPNIFDHFICRDMLAYMKLAAGDLKRQYFLQIMNKPARYFSRDALPGQMFSFEKLEEYYADKDWMLERILKLRTDLRVLSRLNPFASINYIRNAIHYEDYLHDYAEYRRIRPEDLTDTLERLQETTKGLDSLEEWEEHIRQYTEKLQEQAARKNNRTEGVALSTLHRVKGLEYDTVYIMNINEDTIPYRKAVLPEAVEEERRLLYVGMTRARHALNLCYVMSDHNRKRERSRFLSEAGL